MSNTPRVDYLDDIDIPSYKIWGLARELEIELSEAKKEIEQIKQGKVFVDPKWIYDVETQLAQAHEELCQAGLREYGN
jgi:hypothetical protein